MNKKLLITVVFLSSFCSLQAQTEKGGWRIGASSDFSFLNRDTKPSRTIIDLEVTPGYFVADNFVLGLSLGVNSEKEGDASTTVTAIGGYTRYYVNGQFIVGFSYTSLTSGFNDGRFVDTSETVGATGFELGYAYFLGDRVSIEPTLNYLKLSSGGARNTFGLAVAFGLYF